MAARLYGGSFAKGGQFMGWCSAGTAAFEFIPNPTCGCWTDDHGRKKLLLVGPLTGVLTSLLYCLAPDSQKWSQMLIARAVGHGLNALSGTSTTMAAIA